MSVIWLRLLHAILCLPLTKSFFFHFCDRLRVFFFKLYFFKQNLKILKSHSLVLSFPIFVVPKTFSIFNNQNSRISNRTKKLKIYTPFFAMSRNKASVNSAGGYFTISTQSSINDYFNSTSSSSNPITLKKGSN